MTESRQPEENIWQRQQHAKLRIEVAKKVLPVLIKKNYDDFQEDPDLLLSKDDLVDETLTYVDKLIAKVTADAGLESLF